MFHDRVMALRQKVGQKQILPLYVCVGEYHGILDDVDKTLGIKTRHGCASAYYAGAVPFPQSEYVGARLARLEARVSRQDAPRFFWLGAEGEAN